MEASAGRDTQIVPKADGLLWAGEHRDTHPRAVSGLESALDGSGVQLPGRPVMPRTAHLPTAPLLRSHGWGGLTAEAAPPASPFSSPQLGCSSQFSAVSQWQPPPSLRCLGDVFSFPLSSAAGCGCVGRHPSWHTRLEWVRLPPALAGCPRSMAQGKLSWPFMGTFKGLTETVNTGAGCVLWATNCAASKPVPGGRRYAFIRCCSQANTYVRDNLQSPQPVPGSLRAVDIPLRSTIFFIIHKCVSVKRSAGRGVPAVESGCFCCEHHPS